LKSLHTITVFGRQLQVRSSASAEEVRQVEDFVNRKLDEVKSAVGDADTQTLMILALMNIAEAALSQQGCVGGFPDERARIMSIIRRIEQVTG